MSLVCKNRKHRVQGPGLVEFRHGFNRRRRNYFYGQARGADRIDVYTVTITGERSSKVFREVPSVLFVGIVGVSRLTSDHGV